MDDFKKWRFNCNGYFIINDVIVNDVGEQRAYGLQGTSLFLRGGQHYISIFSFQRLNKMKKKKPWHSE